PDEPMTRLAARFPHVLSLVLDPERPPGAPADSYARRLRGRTDEEIADDFVAHVRGGQGPDEHERAALRAALTAARAQEREAAAR
ncbi:exonuclease SbcCD subunit D, partial [Streptomyces sp. URMC 129]